MQDKDKVALIARLCREITEMNTTYSKGTFYYDYEAVIDSLTKTSELMEESLQSPRPEELPQNIVWYESPMKEPDPLVFDGFMEPNDYERWMDRIFGDDSEIELEPEIDS